MGFLLQIDQSLFLWLNHLPHSPFLDEAFLLLSDSVRWFWLFFFVYIFALILIHKKNAGRGFLFLTVATLSGFVTNSFGLKDFFERPRPFVGLPETVLVEEGLTDYSFPSGHAFSAALLAALFLRRKKIFYPLSLYVLLVGFSRIYLGVHFPLDVLGGYVFGLLYGLSVNHFYERFLEEDEFHILKHHQEV